MQYYHLTTASVLPEIMAKGLLPNIGERSALCDENEPAIYLCEAKDVPYWEKILDLHTVISIEAENLDPNAMKPYHYSLYDEICYTKPIPPEMLTEHRKFRRLSDKKEGELCVSYVSDISHICVTFAQYYLSSLLNETEKKEYHDYLKGSTQAVIAALQRLDFSKADPADIRENIRGAINPLTDRCEVYLCNWEGVPIPDYVEAFAERTDAGNEYRLYQMLLHYPNDEFSDMRKQLYKLITKHLRPINCLYMDTGGYEAV